MMAANRKLVSFVAHFFCNNPLRFPLARSFSILTATTVYKANDVAQPLSITIF